MNSAPQVLAKLVTVCGLGRILGYIGARPVGAAMSSQQQQQQQSGSGFGIDGKPDESSRQNGRASADIMADVAKADMSNGFERRSSSQTRQQPAEKESSVSKNEQQNNHHHHHHQQQQQHLEERPASVPVLLTHQPYHDNIVIDRVQFVQQGGAQPIPVHATAQYAPEYVIAAPADSIQYSQIHGAMYNAQGQYVSREANFRDSALYTQIAPQGTYVQQTSSGQPPTYYASKGQPVATGYVHFAPQIHYSQYPQTVMNTAPYGSQKSMYPPPPQYSQQPPQQTVSAQHSPNPQRYSQELSQYQGQPIIQPIAQNVAGHGVPTPPERPSRGPKPMVPPRINSKITHESGHRKSASVDVPNVPKSKGSEGSNGNEQQPTQEHQQGDNQDRRFLQVTVNQSPRTRQDGLFTDANGDSTKDQQQQQPSQATQQQQSGSNDAGNDSGIYVSRAEHRKSVSVDVTSSFPRRNDTITFTFPGDGGANAQPQHEAPILLTARKPVQVAAANASDNKPVLEVNSAPVFPPEQQPQRRIDVNAAMRMSPMPVLPALSVVPKGILVSGERKSVEWSSLSPNQRIVVPQENRRSDYFEEHRRSPMTVDGKRFEEIRRSPMAFVPIRDANPAERINQKSPNNLACNQAFEKTRAELAMWAEQRQRQQEIESRISMQNREIFTTSPRSRNPSEERRPDSRNYIQLDKETRMAVAPSAFQPIANITPSSIMEQRRHLRHVSADLTKHMELTRKEFDDQHLTGSVINLGTTATATATANVMSQRATPSPNICFQYPALSEAKLDTKMALSIVTDFNEPPSKPLEQTDHIIHSHRKSQNLPQNILSIAKGHENSQNHSEQANDKSDGQPSHSQQIFHNQQSIDFISEKLSQCERQQSDLQAKLQSLQNQNEILDKVAQYQYQQNDLQSRMHSLQLQSQIAEKLSQKQSSEFSQSSSHSSSDQEQTNKVILSQCINASRQLYGQPLLTTVPPQMHAGYITERVSPRLQFQQQQQQEDSDCDSMQIPSISQMPLPSLSQFDRADVLSRSSYTQLQQRMQTSSDNLDSIPCSQMSLASLGSLNFTGTLKKVPPEKPPRTSLIVQSPDTEVTLPNAWIFD